MKRFSRFDDWLRPPSRSVLRKSSAGQETVGTMGKTGHKDKDRMFWMFTFAADAYNLVRIRNLMAEPA